MERDLLKREIEYENTLMKMLDDMYSKASSVTSSIVSLIRNGLTDEKALTNFVFRMRHNNFPNRNLVPGDPSYLQKEWLSIRDNIVRPQLKLLKVNVQRNALHNARLSADLTKALGILSVHKNWAGAVAIWVLDGEGVIFEFENGRLKYHLTYPNEDKRMYYKKGDFICTQPISAAELKSLLSNPKDAADEELDLLDIVLAFANDGDEKTYDFAFQILRIDSSEDGNGYVMLQPNVKMEDDWVKISTTRTVRGFPTKYDSGGMYFEGVDYLSGLFIHSKLIPGFKTLTDILKAEATIARMVLGAWAGGFAEEIGRGIMKSGIKASVKLGIKKLVGYLIRKILSAIPKTIIKALIAFAACIAEELQLRRLKEKTLKLDISNESLQPAIIKGINAMATTVVNELFNELIDSKIGLFFSKLMDSVEGGLKKIKLRLIGFFVRKFTALFTVDFITSLTKIISDAWSRSAKTGEDFTKVFADRFVDQLKDWFSEKMKEWGEDLVKDFTEGITDVFKGR